MTNKEIIEECYNDEFIKNGAINSMLLDEFDELAFIKFKDNSYCKIFVNGEKSVRYNNQEYYYTQDYPEELINLIKSKNPEDYEKWSYWDNNWIEFEYVRNGEFLTDGVSPDEFQVDGKFNGTRESIKELMLNLVEKFDNEYKED